MNYCKHHEGHHDNGASQLARIQWCALRMKVSCIRRYHEHPAYGIVERMTPAAYHEHHHDNGAGQLARVPLADLGHQQRHVHTTQVARHIGVHPTLLRP
eukprot:850429-Pelagomonas_calceolata.AAC.1